MRRIIFALVLFSPILSIAQSHLFKIDGRIHISDTPTIIYLAYHVGENGYLDSTEVIKGRFQFKGNINYPVQALLRLKSTDNGKESVADFKFFYLEAGHISVISDSDSLNTARITGTKTNEENQDFEGLTTSIEKRYQLMLEKKKADKNNTDTILLDREMDSLATIRNHDIQSAIVNFIRSHPGSAISIIQLRNFTFDLSYKELQSLYDQLTNTLKQSPDGKAYAQRLANMQLLPLGSAAPLFTAKDTSAQTVNLSSFRGKYVLLDFWASWCSPCRQENPNIVKAYLQYKNKNFTVISISLDENRQNWITAIRQDKLLWTQLSNLDGFRGELSLLYNVSVLPQNILIDTSGKIIAKNLYGNNLQNKLKEILL